MNFFQTDGNMATSTLQFKVTLIWIPISLHIVQSIVIRGELSDLSLVSKIIDYVKPYVQSLQLGPETVYVRSSSAKRSQEIAINEKIKELEPYLQDNDVGEQLELAGDDETPIIEFMLKNHKLIMNGAKYNNTEANIRKYKIMRNKIKLALERESVSNKTKLIVTKTLDELIAMLVQRQCLQDLFQGINQKYLIFKTKSSEKSSNSSEEIIPKIVMDSLICYLNKIKLSDKECKKLKKSKPTELKHCPFFDISEKERKILLDNVVSSNHSCYVGNKKLNEETCKMLEKNITDSILHVAKLKSNKNKEKHNKKLNMYEYFHDIYNSFRKTISKILRDSHTENEKYKVRCTLVDLDKGNMKNSFRNKDICSDFRVCTEELREFLTIFYRSLNDTAVRTFRNYAAMYERDIVADRKQEKNAVIGTIYYAADMVEERVAKAFVKETAKISLDVNKDREVNLAILREYVKQTVKTVNKTVLKHLDADLSALRTRLLLAIKQDLAYNLATDLGHFENDVVQQICSFFLTCKGNLAGVSRSHLLRKKLPVPKDKPNKTFLNSELDLQTDSDLNRVIKNRKAIPQGYRSDEVIAMRSQYSSNNTNAVNSTASTSKDITINNTTTTVNLPIAMQSSDSSEYDDDNEANTLKLIRK